MSDSAITADAIADVLRDTRGLADDEIVTHAVVLVATTRYDDEGRRVTRTHEIYPAGSMDVFVLRGLLHTVLETNAARPRYVA